MRERGMIGLSSYQDIKTPEEEEEERTRRYLKKKEKEEIAMERAEIERDRKLCEED